MCIRDSFKWGLSADLQVPDLEVRIAILRNKMYADGIELPSDVVEYVAHNIDNNAVSYTHLDVYKRQVINRKNLGQGVYAAAPERLTKYLKFLFFLLIIF